MIARYVSRALTWLLNGPRYQLWLLRDDGTRLKRLGNVISFSYTRVVNNVGHFAIVLPGDFDRSLLAYDRRVAIYRKPPGGAMSLVFVGLIRGRRKLTDAGGNSRRTIRGYDLNGLLRRRIVAYAAGSAQAAMTDQADDLITEVVKDNLGSDASASRQLSSTYFSVAASPGAGPSITKAFSYRNVLDVIRDVVDAARQAGTYLFFSIEPTSESAFQFSTRTGEWGRDRTSDVANGLIFSLERGNLAKPVLDEDAADEVNVAYGLGRGEESAREVQTAEDTTRSGASIFARAEAAANAVHETTSAGVADVADGRVQKGRPVAAFSADLLSVPGSVYGKDWGFGDRITVSYDGLQFDCLVRAVTVSVDENGKETINGTVLEALGL
jgi:hypothetical protein